MLMKCMWEERGSAFLARSAPYYFSVMPCVLLAKCMWEEGGVGVPCEVRTLLLPCHAVMFVCGRVGVSAALRDPRPMTVVSGQ